MSANAKDVLERIQALLDLDSVDPDLVLRQIYRVIHSCYAVSGARDRSKLFRVALERSGIRPSQLAQILNSAPQTVNSWKARGAPHKRVVDIAKVLGVAPEDLK